MRRAVWKIPFRLDEIPFFDTKYLCDTSQMTNFTQFEDDVEPWDAPLRRRKTVSTHIHQNLYQIHHSNRRESVYAAINEDDGMIVNELFMRDPTIPLKVIGKYLNF
jgi:myosin-3